MALVSSVGNGDRKIQFQESIDFEFDIKNKTGLSIEECQVAVSQKRQSNKESPIKAIGRPVKVEDIGGGQQFKCRINVLIKPKSDLESATLVFRISDNRNRVLFRKEVDVEITERD